MFSFNCYLDGFVCGNVSFQSIQWCQQFCTHQQFWSCLWSNGKGREKTPTNRKLRSPQSQWSSESAASAKIFQISSSQCSLVLLVHLVHLVHLAHLVHLGHVHHEPISSNAGLHWWPGQLILSPLTGIRKHQRSKNLQCWKSNISFDWKMFKIL